MDRATLESPASRNFKLIVMRILIAGYLMACSVGIAPGPSLVPLLSRLIPQNYALALGTAMVFLPAYTMMAGIWLRGSIHILAMMLALNTILELFVFQAVPKPGVLMQEIVTICAMLQCLMLLKGRHFRHSSIVKKHAKVRRLAPGPRTEPPVTVYEPEAPVQRPAQPPVVINMPPPRRKTSPATMDDDDIVNIFAT
ncbi:hypothetical protein [Shimia sediminis]|uniref:hypothetical protein n=1 Tax=Shimia sediminis TaxID=2497945 RepID=UPI000F8CDE23|nr:hypothetical protein [Shimia sediminis]